MGTFQNTWGRRTKQKKTNGDKTSKKDMTVLSAKLLEFSLCKFRPVMCLLPCAKEGDQLLGWYSAGLLCRWSLPKIITPPLQQCFWVAAQDVPQGAPLLAFGIVYQSSSVQVCWTWEDIVNGLEEPPGLHEDSYCSEFWCLSDHHSDKKSITAFLNM